MKIQQIRNATLVIDYAGKRFLMDPALADKGTYPSLPDADREARNPLNDLPVAVEDILDVDAVIVTHLHQDHWDDKAMELLAKDIKIFAQNVADAKVIGEAGFTNVEVLEDQAEFEGILLTKTKGEHGYEAKTIELMGEVSGVVFKHESEKTLYIAGDTVWCQHVQAALDKHQPEVIVLNAGENKFIQLGSLIMGKEDVYKVHQAAPNASLIASHMEAVNHWGLSREGLAEFAEGKGFSDSLFIPADGESRSF